MGNLLRFDAVATIAMRRKSTLLASPAWLVG